MGHFTVRMSRILKGLLFYPAPAKAMMASRCSYRSPRWPWALSLTCGSEAILVLLRPCSLMALRTVSYLPLHAA